MQFLSNKTVRAGDREPRRLLYRPQSANLWFLLDEQFLLTSDTDFSGGWSSIGITTLTTAGSILATIPYFSWEACGLLHHWLHHHFCLGLSTLVVLSFPIVGFMVEFRSHMVISSSSYSFTLESLWE